MCGSRVKIILCACVHRSKHEIWCHRSAELLLSLPSYYQALQPNSMSQLLLCNSFCPSDYAVEACHDQQ